MSYVDFCGRAVEASRNAKAHDMKGEYQEAFEWYCKAMQALQCAIKYERTPDRRTMLTVLFNDMITRAETLDQFLRPGSGKDGEGSSPTTGSASEKRKPKDGGVDFEDEKNKLRSGLRDSILSEKPNVKWEDVAGLPEAKKALRQAVILPMKIPHVFTGRRTAWRGILLYGPPGTGKTYLAKAAATSCDCTFFSISSSNLMSKWLGESEKLVRNLFEMARENAPSIIFIDEVDSLCSARSEAHQNDATHRVLTEFLAQMDGVGNGGEGVLVLGATNLPWALDIAMRRRFEKRIYISLPDASARRCILDLGMKGHPHTLTEDAWRDIVQATDGYSGADISNLCRAALMNGVAAIEEATHFKRVTEDGKELLKPCSPGDPVAIEMALDTIPPEDLPKVVPTVTNKTDFLQHVASCRSVSEANLQKYVDFTKEFGDTA